MRAGYLAALMAGLALGCVHAPSLPRAAKPREPVVLEAVSFETPAEDGWTIADVADGSRRVVTLEHLAADGTRDRRAVVEEHAWRVEAITPEALAAAARRGLPVTDAEVTVTPPPEEAVALDGRFGARSASATVRGEPKAEGDGKAFRGTLHVRDWIAPAPPDRYVRVSWLEKADAAGVVADARWRELDASLRSPPAPGARRTAPDVEERRWFVFAPGAMIASLRGERVVGGGFRAGAARDGLYPRAGALRSVAFDFGLFAGENDAWSALVATLGATFWQGAGRLRWGVGAELGSSILWVPGTESSIFGLVLGARAAAQVDLLRLRGRRASADVFLEVDGGVAVQSLYRAGAALGIRVSDWPWL